MSENSITPKPTNNSAFKTTAYCIVALLCFAANSVLCRLALGKQIIDPGSFTTVRLVSGALCLALISFVAARKNHANGVQGSWTSGLALFVYAVCFSFAYMSLDTGTGALMLFGSVQISMIAWQYIKGKRLSVVEWLGVFIAFAGLSYLVYPVLATPVLHGMLLMGLAGCAWGVYTIRGKSSRDPLGDTTFNFLRTLPWVLLLAVVIWPRVELTGEGLLYAGLSGALASGIGYALWYVALENLSTTLAAVSQLSVPVIAALGGVVLVGEALSLRLTLASIFVLGGIGLVIYHNTKRA